MPRPVLEIEKLMSEDMEYGETYFRIIHMDESLRSQSGRRCLGEFGDWSFRSSNYPDIKRMEPNVWVFYLRGNKHRLDEEILKVPREAFLGLVVAIERFNEYYEGCTSLYDELFERIESDA